MRKIMLAAAMSLAPFAAQASSKITVFYVPSGGDTRQCVFIQVDSQTMWYAVPKSDPMFNEVYAFLLSTAATGQLISFNTSGTACGSPRLQDMLFGVAN